MPQLTRALFVRDEDPEMNRYCHIIWDWNGTLLDDVWLCVDIVNGMLTRRGVPGIDIRRYKEIFDFPVRTYYERAGFDFSQETFGFAATEFCDEYARRVGECCLHDGAKELLQKCNASGVRQSILSATEQGRLETMIAAFGLSTMFGSVVGQSDHYATGKVRKAKELVAGLDAPSGEVLLIGDTTHDSYIAGEVGVDSVLVAMGHHSREKLEKTGTRVVGELSHVEGLLQHEERA